VCGVCECVCEQVGWRGLVDVCLGVGVGGT
jgi:hypothetical protein